LISQQIICQIIYAQQINLFTVSVCLRKEKRLLNDMRCINNLFNQWKFLFNLNRRNLTIKSRFYDNQIRIIIYLLKLNVKINCIRFLLDSRICKHLKNNIAFFFICFLSVFLHIFDKHLSYSFLKTMRPGRVVFFCLVSEDVD
jgi:hypothetical protein